MKKILFFLFAICLSAPSFADKCGNQRVIDGTNLLYYNFGTNELGTKVQCDTTNNEKLMVGCDGQIYKCNGKEWERVSNNSMTPCPSGWGAAASKRIRPENTILNPTIDGDIYFFTPDQKIYVLENSICKYTKTQCDKDQAACKESGRIPINCSICAPFTITCDDTKGNGCQIDGNDWKQYVVNNCNEIGKGRQLTKDSPIIINTQKTSSLCDSAINKAHKEGKCIENQGRYVGGYYVVVCDNDDFIKTKGTKYDGITDANWSYAEKKCRGSGGDFNNGKCTCSNTQTRPENGECLCINGNTKYPIDNSCSEGTACISTGGDPRDDDSGCNCPADKNMHPVKLRADSEIKVCECNKGFQYRDPMRRWEGCVKTDGTVNIGGTVIGDDDESIPQATVTVSNSTKGTTTDNNGTFFLEKVPNTEYVTFSFIGYEPTTWAATDLQNNPTVKMYTNTETLSEVTVTASPLTQTQSEQVAPTGTKEYECTKSGGDKYENGKCICDADKHLVEYNPDNAQGYSICKCVAGYKRDSKDNCVDAGDYETHEEFDSAAWRKDTEDAYRNEYDNAQSWANKGTTALSTLMTGEGAMMAARAIAEQKADKKAEEQMAEWISKMGCEYGNGQQVNLGKEETLPVGDLAKYYAEYKQLADKLKETKTALNLRPGIESEVLYDRAETGLYQYANAERQSGGFTSLSRALMNPEGADAEQWNAQRAETNRDLWVGGTLATVGLAGSYIANRAINKDHVKKYKELEEKFREIKTMIERRYPEAFIFTEPEIQQQESPTITETVVQESEPSVTVTPQLPKLNPFKDNYLFDSGKWVLKSTHSALDEYITYIVDTFKDEKYLNSKICINVDGYTDWIPPKPGFVSNKVLSERRAQAVSDYIKTKTGDISNHIRNITPTGHGDEQCNRAIYKTEEELQTCRRVEINIRDCSDL